PLNASGDVGGVTQSELLLAAPSTYVADDHQPGVDTDADSQAYPWVLRQTDIERSQRFNHVKTSPHSSSGVVFMRLWITKVHQQAIPEVLRNMAIKALDDGGRGLLIGAYDLAPIVWVELDGEERRVEGGREHDRGLET